MRQVALALGGSHAREDTRYVGRQMLHSMAYLRENRWFIAVDS